VISKTQKWVTSRRTKSLFLIAIGAVLFGISTPFWIEQTNWLFPNRAIGAWESWAVTSRAFGIACEMAGAFSWISDNVVRKQRPWWTL
jgi:hypothetical protein